MIAKLILIFILVDFALLFWLYLGYHLFLYFLALISPRKLKPSFQNLPPLSLVITVHNEETFIERKIKNTQALDYDHAKLEIIVVDDHSTDRTCEIVRRFPEVKLLTKKERTGKARSVNLGIRAAKNPVVVISDGNALLNREALKIVAAYFFNPKVAAVTGIFQPIIKTASGVGKGEGIFWILDKVSLKHESDWDSAVYTCGQITAFRKKVMREVSENNLTEDFEFALNIRKQGFRVICDPGAVSQKYSCDSEKDLLIQRKRRAIGTLQTLKKFRGMLFNPRYGLFGMIFLPSHKLFQMLSPFLVLILYGLVSLALLISGENYFYWLGIALGGFLVLSALSFMLKKWLPFLSFLYLFWFGQWIVLISWLDYCRGNYTVTWQQIKSSR